jgi:hypothetical protein
MPDQTQQAPVPTPDQLSTAANAGPQLSTAIAGSPTPSADASPTAPTTAPTAPTSPAGAAAAPALAAAQPQPNPQQQAAIADVQHHAVLGKVTSALLGQQYDFRVNPETGQTEKVAIQQKPGDLFRHILAGAILGGAAGADASSKGQGGGAQFIGGAKAVTDASQATDQQRRAQAQTAFANQQAAARGQREQNTEDREDQKAADEKIKTAAQFELQNREALLHERDSNLRDQDFNERHNERMETLRDKATESGAVDAPIEGNGQPGNGAKFEQLFAKQPELFQPPQGYNRLVTTDVDMKGLTYDQKLGWVDATGRPIDLKDRTSWHVQYLPVNSGKEPLEFKGSDLNKLLPKTAGTLLQPDKIYRLPFDGVVALATKEHELNRTAATDAYKYKHDELAAQLGELKNKADNYTREAISADRRAEFDPQAAADAKEFRQKADDAYNEYDKVQAQSNPHSQLRMLDSGRNNPASVKPGVVIGQKVTLKNGRSVTVSKVNQDGTFEYK